jgi:outer membrane receptor for ferrienterochelin and colicin
MNEINSRIENKIILNEQQTLDIGAGLLYYYTDKLEESSSITQVDETSTLQLPYLYIQDNITLFKKLTLRPGIRTDFYSLSEKIYLQPRFQPYTGLPIISG